MRAYAAALGTGIFPKLGGRRNIVLAIFVIAIAIGLYTPIVARANVTYTYTGNPFSLPQCAADYPPNPDRTTVIVCISGSITASVTFDKPGGQLLSGSITAVGQNGQTYKFDSTNSAARNGGPPIFEFSGNNIVGWDFGVSAFGTSNSPTVTLATTYLPDPATYGYDASYVPIDTFGNTADFPSSFTIGENKNSPGSWTQASCQSLIKNSLQPPPYVAGGGTQIIATFTPQVKGYTLAQAAQVCGYTGFDWVQTITHLPDPSPFCELNSDPSVPNPSPFSCGESPLTSPFPIHLTSKSTPLNDPPANGYTYYESYDPFPFYYPSQSVIADIQSSSSTLCAEQQNGACTLYVVDPSGTALHAFDAPADPCISEGLPAVPIASPAYLLHSAVRALCGNSITSTDERIEFKTSLVGIKPDGTAASLGPFFTWTSNYNGTFGGIATTVSTGPVDPGSGTGGINIINVQESTTTPPAPRQLSSGTACNGVYTGPFNGNVTVSTGQTCTFVDGTINGNVQENGGNLVLSVGDLISGNLQIKGGTFAVGPYATIDGNLQVQNLPSGTALNQICGSSVYGNLQFQNNGTAVQIGSASLPCTGNAIGGNLQVQNNKASTAVFDNTVGGNLQDQNNTASTQVFSNTVKGNLQCQNNSSITGGGNIDGQKQGQCSSF